MTRLLNDADVLSVENIFKDKYVIPLYQRNFAWGEEQISRLLQDIYESMLSGDEHFYVGSLIVLQRGNGEFEVIDGQQRLTMLSILSGILNMGMPLTLRYDSRPEVEDFFRILNSGEMPKNRKDSTVSHFFDAIDIIWSTQLDVENTEPITLRSESIKNKMVDYLKHNVCLVREIMPADTDVAAYFEIMNNRGEQLQEHEIVKGLLLGKLYEEGNGDYSSICSKIWDACSQMEKRIQKSFTPSVRKILFGNDCDLVELNGASNSINYGNENKSILESLKGETKGIESLTLEEIVNQHFDLKLPEELPSFIDESPNEESIIDFSNFLMHIFRLYYNQSYRARFENQQEAKDIPLSEKFLLKVYNTIKQDVKPVDFFLRLLYCRFIFDRYIIKSNITEDDEKREWVLLKPYIYEDEKRNSRSLRFKPTFDDKEKQDAIIRAISCLQVSFRTKPYKNYLQTILKWFVNDTQVTDVTAESYLEKLHRLMLDEFNRTSKSFIGIKEYDEKHQGTSVPHYLFNFTDYLYWRMNEHLCQFDWCDTNSEQLESIKHELELIRKTDFRFLNRNSIEHHYPQKRQEEHQNEGVSNYYLNCLGNLILISKSGNSRLSDKNPVDKAALFSGRTDLPPTRQIVYSITRNVGWGKEQIKDHLACLEAILAHRDQILG